MPSENTQNTIPPFTQNPIPSLPDFTADLYKELLHDLDTQALSRNYKGDYGEYRSYLLSPEKRDADGNQYHDVYVLNNERVKNFQSDLYRYLSEEYLNEQHSAYSDKKPPKISELYDEADRDSRRVYVKHSQDPTKREAFLRNFLAYHQLGSVVNSGFDDLQTAVSKLSKPEQDRFYAYASQLPDAGFSSDFRSEHSEHLSLYTNPADPGETDKLSADELVQRAINHPAAFNEPQHIFQTQDSRGNAITSFRFEPGQRYPFTAYNDPTQDPLIARAIETAHKDAASERGVNLGLGQELNAKTHQSILDALPSGLRDAQNLPKNLQEAITAILRYSPAGAAFDQKSNALQAALSVFSAEKDPVTGKRLPNLIPAAARAIMPNIGSPDSIDVGKVAKPNETSLSVPKRSGMSK